jgi:hypothetical protein
MLHSLAAPLACRGVLIVASFGEDPLANNPKTGRPGKPLAPKVRHFQIGDIDAMGGFILSLSREPHRNVYAPLAVFRPDLPAGKKGQESDIVGVIGVVADFDDGEAHRWPERLPLPANYALETSAGRFQAFYVFDQPYSVAEAKAIAERLKQHADCDHGTRDVSHVWRVAGTLNWPNARKAAQGRPLEPQPVKVAQPWTGTVTALSALAAALPEVDAKTSGPETEGSDENGAAGGQDDPASEGASAAGDDTVEAMVGLLPLGLRNRITEPSRGDRSRDLFIVISALVERGMTDALIERIIRHYPQGIGAKYVGRNDLDEEIARIRLKVEGRGEGDGRPLIRVTGGKLPEIVDAAEEALMAAGLGLYQRGSSIVRPVFTDIEVVAGGGDRRRTIKASRLVTTKLAYVAECMTRAARWERYDGRSRAWVPIDCPPKVAETYLQRDGLWRLPILTGVVNAPTIRPDGSVLDQPGYDAATGLLYEPYGVVFPAIPANPSRDDALTALARLIDLIVTFPFVTEADRAVALSAILTTIIRRSLRSAPLHGFDAPTAGSGKSMLVDICAMIATGRQAPVISMGKDEVELEKRLGAALIAGDTLISIDNVDHPLGGELFCQIMTQERLKIRVLGHSINTEVPSNAALFATGNNMVIQGDMTRRALVCTLDPGCERPELRQFATNPIQVAGEQRARLVVDALTVLHAFGCAGRPEQRPPLGSFEVWSSCVRDCLIWLGCADPCETMEKARSSDPKLEALTAVLEQWGAVIGDRRVSVKEVIDIAVKSTDFAGYRSFHHDAFREALLVVAGDGGAINSRRLGKWLSANQGRIVGRRKIIPDGIVTGIAQWKLVGGKSETAEPSEAKPQEATNDEFEEGVVG